MFIMPAKCLNWELGSLVVWDVCMFLKIEEKKCHDLHLALNFSPKFFDPFC